jgi:hypothetical protein
LPTWKVTALLSNVESDGTTTDQAAAAAQLAALQSGRAQMAERAMQPWWYDVLVGLLVFGLFSSYSLHNTWMAAGFAAEHLLDRRGSLVVAGAVLGVGIAFIGRWWTRSYIAELREGR